MPEKLVCDRCGRPVTWGRETTRRGDRVLLGGSCGCVERWLHYRELWEFEVTGVLA